LVFILAKSHTLQLGYLNFESKLLLCPSTDVRTRPASFRANSK